MKTIVFVRLNDGKVIASLQRDANYTLEDWKYVFAQVGDVLEFKHVDYIQFGLSI